MVKEAILIAVYDGKHGYGNFLFALKLAQQLKNKYAAVGDDDEAPLSVYVVTGDNGKQEIIALKGDTEFGVEVLTPKELAEKTKISDDGRIHVDMIIEGPVFDPTDDQDFMREIGEAIPKTGDIPLLMVTEYSMSPTEARDLIGEDIVKRNSKAMEYYGIEHIKYNGIVYSGLSSEQYEEGILLSDQLINPAPSLELIRQLDDKLRNALTNTAGTLQDNTELSMQYSHDRYTQRVDDNSFTPASHFLRVHRQFIKESEKNQNVVMVGHNLEDKHKALVGMKDQLIDDGFTRIAFYNTATDEEEILHHDDDRTPSKSYRVVYTPSMTHQSMMACSALSGPLCGATGDQSFGEAISANKIIVYEELPHKKQLIVDYDSAMSHALENSGEVKESLHLLRSAQEDEDYQRLGALLRNPTTQEKLIQANQLVREKQDLLPAIEFCVTQSLSAKHAINQPATLSPQIMYSPDPSHGLPMNPPGALSVLPMNPPGFSYELHSSYDLPQYPPGALPLLPQYPLGSFSYDLSTPLTLDEVRPVTELPRPKNYRTHGFDLMGTHLTIGAMAGPHNNVNQHGILSYLGQNENRKVLIGLHEDDFTEIAQCNGLEYHHIPIQDGVTPPLETYDQIYQIVRKSTEEGKQVTIHCGHGDGRAGTALASLKLRELLENEIRENPMSINEDPFTTEGDVRDRQGGLVYCTPLVQQAIEAIRTERQAPDNDLSGENSVETSNEVQALINYERHLRVAMRAELSNENKLTLDADAATTVQAIPPANPTALYKKDYLEVTQPKEEKSSSKDKPSF